MNNTVFCFFPLFTHHLHRISFSASLRSEWSCTVIDPKSGSCLIVTPRPTRCCKRSSRHRLMKAPEITSVCFLSFCDGGLHFPWKSVVTVRVCPCLAGQAVTFTSQYLLSTSAGRRPTVPGVVVIIADRRSADDLTPAANSLRAAGLLEH